MAQSTRPGAANRYNVARFPFGFCFFALSDRSVPNVYLSELTCIPGIGDCRVSPEGPQKLLRMLEVHTAAVDLCPVLVLLRYDEYTGLWY